MANGLDKFPGHAYAPGMEPKFWDGIVVIGHDAVGGVSALPLLAVAVVLLVLCLSRVFGPRTRLRLSGTSATSGGRHGAIIATRSAPDHAEILARTIMDSNFARELRESRSDRVAAVTRQAAD
jgi:hypothetical protein